MNIPYFGKSWTGTRISSSKINTSFLKNEKHRPNILQNNKKGGNANVIKISPIASGKYCIPKILDLIINNLSN